MSEMIERVAKAIEKACAEAAHDEDEYCSPGMAKAAARAAIKAMREPTLAMRKVSTFTAAEVDWPAMIDAALPKN